MTRSAAVQSLILLLTTAACLQPVAGTCPDSCENFACPGSNSSLNVCVLRKVVCFSPPCDPLRTCIFNQCTAMFCAVAGTRCASVRTAGDHANCSPWPSCQVGFSCVPRAKPKPGFCRPAAQVPAATSHQCTYDNDCASDLLCCASASDHRRCAAPDCNHPCLNKNCPLYAPTCGVRGGQGICLDRVCQPGTYFCTGNKQAYCSDAAVIKNTNLPC